MEQSLNRDDFGVIGLASYSINNDPTKVAIQNEMVRHYKEGMLRVLTLVDELIAEEEAHAQRSDD